MMDIGTVIIIPDPFCPWVFGGGFGIKENHVGLYAIGIKYAGGQAQGGMQIGGFQDLFADQLACAAFK
jgi:hypothetical protein